MTRARPSSPEVSAAEFTRIYELCKNWGRWGSRDENGALNLITPERVAVELDADEVAGEAEIPRVADVDVLQDRHVVQYRLRIVGSGAGVQRPGA